LMIDESPLPKMGGCVSRGCVGKWRRRKVRHILQI
jgi:hypothetical protein